MAITPIQKKKELYSDFRKDMRMSPINDDVARRTNEDAVKESIRNLLLTNRGERLFQPNVGSDIKKMLFENMTPDVIKVLEDLIRNCIETHEPRCNLIEVNCNGALDDNGVFVQIVFNVLNKENPVELDIFLERVR